MYLPEHFQEHDQDEIKRLIAAYSLAQVVRWHRDGFAADPLPLFLTPNGNELIGHIARRNPLAAQLGEELPILALFQGQDGYVSPNLYATKAETHQAVPTWNYQTVHIHGRLTLSDDDHSKRAAVGLLTRDHERRVNGAQAWKMADAPAEYMVGMLANILALRIDIDRIEAKTKASQNRRDRDRLPVADHLASQGKDALAARVRKG